MQTRRPCTCLRRTCAENLQPHLMRCRPCLRCGDKRRRGHPFLVQITGSELLYAYQNLYANVGVCIRDDFIDHHELPIVLSQCRSCSTAKFKRCPYSGKPMRRAPLESESILDRPYMCEAQACPCQVSEGVSTLGASQQPPRGGRTLGGESSFVKGLSPGAALRQTHVLQELRCVLIIVLTHEYPVCC